MASFRPISTASSGITWSGSEGINNLLRDIVVDWYSLNGRKLPLLRYIVVIGAPGATYFSGVLNDLAGHALELPISACHRVDNSARLSIVCVVVCQFLDTHLCNRRNHEQPCRDQSLADILCSIGAGCLFRAFGISGPRPHSAFSSPRARRRSWRRHFQLSAGSKRLLP